MEKKKVIIIGGGVSGFATAIYLQLNGYETLVLEKNAVAGGACIGWERKGCYIDGCIHWLVGVDPKSSMYKMWETTGALSPEVRIYQQNDFYTLDFGGENKFIVWAELDRMQAALIEFAPEDEKQIKKFCKLIKRFERVEAPVDKPVDHMNIFELCKIGFTMCGDYYYVSKTSKMSCRSFASQFKNPYLKRWISEHMDADYNFMSFLYMLSRVTSKNGGIPEGGSLALVERMEKKYLSLGGELRVKSEVESIDVENGVAVGVTMKGGERIRADWVVSATPAEHTLKTLLGNEYHLRKFDERFKDRGKYPIYTFTTAVFKVNADMSQAPLSHKVYVNEPIRMEREHNCVTFRNYSYDKTLKAPEGSCVVQATLGGNDSMFFWWQEVKKNGEYREKKAAIAQLLLKAYLNSYPELEGKVEVIDVITPMTYNRYLNGRNGAFQGFVHTPRGKSLMQKGEIKGLKNFVLSGQWLLRSGGLPPALIVGKFAAQRICKKDGVEFKDE